MLSGPHSRRTVFDDILRRIRQSVRFLSLYRRRLHVDAQIFDGASLADRSVVRSRFSEHFPLFMFVGKNFLP
jgi:hypothetical protein